MKKTFLPLLFLALSASTFAHVVDGPDLRTKNHFNYSATNLSSPAAIAELHGQIARFAHRYCNSQRLSRISPPFRCFKHVEEEIVEKIDDARLTAYAANG